MLVVFDCDGVLVDSEHLAAEVFADVLASIGVTMCANACFKQFKGWSLAACFVWIEQRYSLQLPDDFLDILNTATRQRFNRDLQAVKYVERVLDFLNDRSIPFCVASNGSQQKMDLSLSSTGLAPYFPIEKRFSAHDVTAGKPAPDVFLKAAETEGVRPSFCWVVEDSLAGCTAAQAAGMNLIYFNAAGELDSDISATNPIAVCSTMQCLLDFFSTSCPENSTYN